MDNVLKFKSGGHFKRKLFFTGKKRYILNTYTICNFNKKFIYVLAVWLNFQYNT